MVNNPSENLFSERYILAKYVSKHNDWCCQDSSNKSTIKIG